MESTVEKTKPSHATEQKQMSTLNFFGPAVHSNDLNPPKITILPMSNFSAKYTHWFNHKGTMNSPFQLSKNFLRDHKVPEPIK